MMPSPAQVPPRRRRRSRPAEQVSVGRRLGAALGVLAMMFGLLVGLTAPQVAMAPAANADPTLGPDADGDLPVSARITRLDPSAASPGATIRVEGTLVNTSNREVRDVNVSLHRGALQTTRGGLTDVDGDPPAYATVASDVLPIADVLPPGASIPFTYTTTVDALFMSDLGVYPVLFSVDGTVDDVTRRVGQAATYIPFFPEPPLAPAQVAWLWPLVDRPHRGVNDAVFLDDDLATSLREGGRLDRMLALASGAVSKVDLTLAVDPGLLDDVEAMSKGYLVADPNAPDGTTEGSGQAVALSWLARVTELAAEVPVVALPYADVDVGALDAAGLADQAEQARSAGAETVNRVLDVDAIDTIAWPADGAMPGKTLESSVADGVTSFVLSASSLENPSGYPPDVDEDEPQITQNPVSPLPAQAGQANALVTDPTVNAIVSGGGAYAGGPRLAEQRYLAELAMIVAENPTVPRTLVVTPPRWWDPPAGFAGEILGAGGTQSWLRPANVAELADSPANVDRGPLVYPPPGGSAQLGGAPMSDVSKSVANLVDFRSTLSNTDARSVLAPYDRGIWRATSSAWRVDPERYAAAAGALRTEVESLRGRVALVPPADGTYTLSSSSAPLVLTVTNPLPVPVKVVINITARGVVGLRADDIGVQEIPANSRRTLQIPTTVERSGTFAVQAQLSTPDGGALGPSVQLTVRSTAYGLVALIVTGGAGALVLLLIARRLIRRIRDGRRAPDDSMGPPDDGDGLTPDPGDGGYGGFLPTGTTISSGSPPDRGRS